MGTRPLRQYDAGEVSIEVDEAFGGVTEPWRRHRRRFLETLGSLDAQQWAAPTRCDDWNVKDVVNHLITVDAFWVVSLGNAVVGSPTRYLRDFDPSTTPEALVEPMRAHSADEVLDRFSIGTEALMDAVDAIGEADAPAWQAPGESPVGNVAARFVLAHGLWDSWLHERDIAAPLGMPLPVEPDELTVCAWYSLLMGGLEGGLLNDPTPVGPGLEAAIDVTLDFDDLPDRPMRVRIDEGVRIGRAAEPGRRSGSAAGLVDALTGRIPNEDGLGGLPDELAAQLTRARQVL